MDNYKQEYTEFIETAIHDLDAPLRKLLFFTERLSQKLENTSQDDVQETISRMQSCVNDMRSLIDGLALLSRIGTETMEITACDLDAIAKKAWVGAAAGERNVTIHFDPLPGINGDAVQLKQLFKNLFENSIKFSDPNLPLTINVRQGTIGEEEKQKFTLPPGKTFYKIEISDNGTGFDVQYAEKIFKPFVRLHSKSQYPGTGLGLAICKKITDNHEGVIYAGNNENSGACFVLILPQNN